jgi:hypothetical protein
VEEISGTETYVNKHSKHHPVMLGIKSTKKKIISTFSITFPPCLLSLHVSTVLTGHHQEYTSHKTSACVMNIKLKIGIASLQKH